ncbi:MAG TPA: hypothetical protein PKZ64_18050, partial [Spirochaetota bacterium]|nr:hypothetical protein [Spirochaetota bacterium]
TVAFYTMIIPVSAKIANKFYSEVQFSVYLKVFMPVIYYIVNILSGNENNAEKIDYTFLPFAPPSLLRG